MHEIKKALYLFSVCIIPYCIIAQPLPDSVKATYNKAATDYAKHNCLNSYLQSIRSDNSFPAVAQQLRNYFKNKRDESSISYIEVTETGNMSKTGDYVNALDKALALVKKFYERKDNYGEVLALYRVSQAYWYGGDIMQSHVSSLEQLPLALKVGNDRELMLCYNAIATDGPYLNKTDSGIFYGYKALEYARKVNKDLLSTAYATLGENYLAKKDFDSALVVSIEGLQTVKDISTKTSLYTNIAQAFLGKHISDSVKYYADIVISMSLKNEFKDQLQLGYECLSGSYELAGNTDSAFKYYKLAVVTKDELYSTQKASQIKAITQREVTRKQQAEKEKTELETRIKMYVLLSGLLVIIIIAFILYRNNRQKNKVNKVLATTLTNLKATQSQLIQSEKMASLGELTAGIAHEIQNPLNFVNNFSEVNKELLDELQQELKAGKINDAIEISNDIKDNSEKITHHGKRADAIVKGMLQHSRSSSGVKEPTDINALCDEYLRLSYHGLRAKDKSFNATIKTDFDNSLEKINIIPQDIGRVVLNLLTNAFYVVDEKKKSGVEGYEPTVSISTKKVDDKVLISVTDNGNGIPQKVLDKIFQPFFTTKPTGQGTGLCLSLSYDIVKAHGGEMKVETKEGEGTTFIILLPT
ncbi:MAG: ATP-binding protein [Ferruginibacter sp.]